VLLVIVQCCSSHLALGHLFVYTNVLHTFFPPHTTGYYSKGVYTEKRACNFNTIAVQTLKCPCVTNKQIQELWLRSSVGLQSLARLLQPCTGDPVLANRQQRPVTRESILRGHMQTILRNINVIMTLRPDPPPPTTNIVTFWGLSIKVKWLTSWL
jgi:hypothetical protein